MGKYDDIIDLPHYRSKFRTPMSMENRAAQFAPFAALSGHEEAISETARLTDRKIELTDSEKIKISGIIQQAYNNGSLLRITYFCEDKFKRGGTYKSIRGRISVIDDIEHVLIFKGGEKIKISAIISASSGN